MKRRRSPGHRSCCVCNSATPSTGFYPLFQFTADGQVPGVAEVVTTLSPVLLPLSIASWLTSLNQRLDARPIDVLRAGGTARVLLLVRQLASDTAG